MANKITKIVAVALIVLAILLGFYAWLLGRTPPQRVVPGAAQTVAVQKLPMVVATKTLPAGQPIPLDALGVRRVPARPAGSFADPSQVAGRVPAADIAANMPVLDGSLASGLADQVQPGERAVAIKVDDTIAVGGRIRPGNFVDVFVNLKRSGAAGINGGAEIPQTQARLLLSRIRVLAFGDALPGRDVSNAQTGGARTAVLAVPTAQVDALALAEANGRLVLALRNPRDDDVAATTVAVRAGGPAGLGAANPSSQAAAGLALSEIAHSPPPPRPAARTVDERRGGGAHIEVIRGGRVETVAY